LNCNASIILNGLETKQNMVQDTLWVLAMETMQMDIMKKRDPKKYIKIGENPKNKLK
jgi:hypothetical protein